MNDPLELLHADYVFCRAAGSLGPITWSAGDTWISKDGPDWWLDDDQPATEDQVREVINRAGCITELHFDKVPTRSREIYPSPATGP